MNEFLKYKENIYSQHGEDGIIREILKRLSYTRDNHYCEFGAWDGMYLSNTCALIKEGNCKALLIEPNKKKFKELCENFPSDEIIKVNSFVEIKGEKSLDNFLEKYNFNINFDFLSIDVDSIDYHIFNSMDKFKPKIICIEYNPTIPNEVEFVQNIKSRNHGSSAKSIIKLAKCKNYFVICATSTNLLFVHGDYKNKVIGNNIYEIDDVIDDKKIKNYIFYGYDGSIFTSREVRLPWHNIKIKDLNVLKGFLKKYPKDYNYIENKIFKIYRKLKDFF